MSKEIDAVEWRSVCPMCSALDVIGDRWSLLIVRDLLIHGKRTYSDFLAFPEKISTNILASRLDLLTRLKLIERINPKGNARNNAFQLTESGKALRTVLEGLGKWAHTHLRDFHGGIAKIS